MIINLNFMFWRKVFKNADSGGTTITSDNKYWYFVSETNLYSSNSKLAPVKYNIRAQTREIELQDD